jgi:hypothetical protein
MAILSPIAVILCLRRRLINTTSPCVTILGNFVFEWLIEGKPKIVKQGDVVFINRLRKHKITAIGDKMAIRLAVSRADVDHVYEPEDFQ